MQGILSAGQISFGPPGETEMYLHFIITCPLHSLRQEFRRLPKSIFIFWDVSKALVIAQSRAEVRNH